MNDEVQIEVIPYKPEPKWYQSFGWKILTFIFLMPVWVVIICTDPAERRSMKIFSIVMLIFAIWLGIVNGRWDRDSRAVHRETYTVRPL
ncbi:MAG: hypothetical protein WCS52_19395 [bacterium]|jgi:hypothetical protein